MPRRWLAMPKQPGFDKRSAGTPGKNPLASSVKVRKPRRADIEAQQLRAKFALNRHRP
jgi:hypothetical protein